MSAGIWVTPRFATSVWPIYPHSYHHYSNCQKVSPLTPRFATSMCDPYTSTHTIITVTVKKCHHSSQDLPPLCMTHIPALMPSLQYMSKSVTSSPPDLPALCIPHIPALIPSLQ